MTQQVFVSGVQFWQFSLKFYGYKHNKEVLLELQDSAELNVNLILFACFLASKKLPFDIRTAHYLTDSISQQDSIIKQLRQKRRAFKAEMTTMDIYKQKSYKRLLEQELELEKQQQALLVDSYNNRCAELALELDNNDAFSGLSSEGFFLTPAIINDPVKQKMIHQNFNILRDNLETLLTENCSSDDL